jgi:hypothetical protein
VHIADYQCRFKVKDFTKVGDSFSVKVIAPWSGQITKVLAHNNKIIPRQCKTVF